MAIRCWFPGLVAGLVLAAPPAPANEKAQPERIARLVEQLGSDRYAERERASEALDALGVTALAALRAAAKSDDMEVRRRAEALLNKLERILERERILAPTRVRLTYKDTPLQEALADLNRKTGYNIAFQGPADRLKGRTVTLDTAETSFWEALDAFCARSNLAEVSRFARSRAALERTVEGRQLLQRRGGVLQGPMSVDYTPVNGQILLLDRLLTSDGKRRAIPTQFVGALRFRGGGDYMLSPVNRNEYAVPLEIACEPKLQFQNVPEVRIDRAVDEHGQELVEAQTPLGAAPLPPVIQLPAPGVFPAGVPVQGLQSAHIRDGISHFFSLRLLPGEKPARVVRELRGTLLAQIRTEPQPVLVVGDVMLGAPKEARGKDGGILKVLDANREEDTGRVTLRVEFVLPPGVLAAAPGTVAVNPGLPHGAAPAVPVAPVQPAPPGLGLQPQVNAAAVLSTRYNYSGLMLLDDKGQSFRIANINMSVRVNAREFTFTYQPGGHNTAPKHLVFYGCRNVLLDVPFALKDVPAYDR